MKKFLPIVIVILLIAGAAFYGGMKYGQSNPPAGGQNFRNLSPNLSPDELQQRFQAGGEFQGVRIRSRNQAGGGFVTGEIISKDDKSITVKLFDGGSKIIFFSDSAKITKSAEGTSSDLEVGKTVVANGTTNQDGSITAESIQLR